MLHCHNDDSLAVYRDVPVVSMGADLGAGPAG